LFDILRRYLFVYPRRVTYARVTVSLCMCRCNGSCHRVVCTLSLLRLSSVKLWNLLLCLVVLIMSVTLRGEGGARGWMPSALAAVSRRPVC